MEADDNILLAQGVPDFSILPPWAQAIAYTILAIAFALTFAAARFGIHLGTLRRPSVSGAKEEDNRAQVAAVIVDPSALHQATAAVEALNVTLMQSNSIRRGAIKIDSVQTRSISELAQALVQLVKAQSELGDLIGKYIADQREEREEAEMEKRLKDAEEKGYERAKEEEKKRPGRA